VDSSGPSIEISRAWNDSKTVVVGCPTFRARGRYFGVEVVVAGVDVEVGSSVAGVVVRSGVVVVGIDVVVIGPGVEVVGDALARKRQSSNVSLTLTILTRKFKLHTVMSGSSLW
jgi:hypothetical protein